MDLLLTAAELVELTGYRRYASQRRWLTRRGIPHFVDAGGRPRVARATIVARLCGAPAAPAFELGAVR